MSVVSNASPLTNLARIGKLDLLRQLYGELLIPEAVWHKVVIEGVGQPGANEVKVATWIKTQKAQRTLSLLPFYFPLKGRKTKATSLMATIQFYASVYMFRMTIYYGLCVNVFFSALSAEKNISFLCELCALSEAGGEKILPLTRIAKLGPSA